MFVYKENISVTPMTQKERNETEKMKVDLREISAFNLHRSDGDKIAGIKFTMGGVNETIKSLTSA